VCSSDLGSIGAKLQGYIYGNFGEKAVLSQKWLATHAEEAGGAVWDGKVNSLEALTGVSRSEAFLKMQEVSGLDATGATDLLWVTYNPGLTVWLPFVAIGVVSTIALVVFARMARRWRDMDV